MKEGEWRWLRSGKKLDFTAWCEERNEPNGKKAENCIEMAILHHKEEWTALWNDLDCESKCRPICQKFKSTEASTDNCPQAINCPRSWINAGSLGCFYVGKNDGLKTWKEAHVYCQNIEENGGLAEIYDEVTQSLINGLILQDPKHDYWIAGTDAHQVIMIKINFNKYENILHSLLKIHQGRTLEMD